MSSKFDRGEAFDSRRDARRGTNLWRLNVFRSTILSKLIVDLKALENVGFSDEICRMVRQILFSLIAEMRRLQAEGGSGFQVQRLLAEVEAFDRIYHDWNNVEGNDEFAARMRRNLLKRLQGRRYRLSRVVRRNQREFHAAIDDELIEVTFRTLGELLTEHPGEFPQLRRAYLRYVAAPGRA